MSRAAVNRIVERMRTPINRWGYNYCFALCFICSKQELYPMSLFL